MDDKTLHGDILTDGDGGFGETDFRRMILRIDGEVGKLRIDTYLGDRGPKIDFVARRMTGAAVAGLTRGDKVLSNSSSILDACLRDQDGLHLCIVQDHFYPWEDLRVHKLHSEYRELAKGATGDAPIKLHGYSTEVFGPDLATKVVQALLNGHRVERRMRCTIRRKLLMTSTDDNWRLFKAPGPHGCFVWYFGSKTVLGRWQSDDDFVEFWSEQTDKSIVAFTACILFQNGGASIQEMRLEGALKRTDLFCCLTEAS